MDARAMRVSLRPRPRRRYAVARLTRFFAADTLRAMASVRIEDTRVKGRRRTATCWVGLVPVGGDHPVVVQSMTNTDTEDAASTAEQVRLLAEAGSEIVRVTVNTRAAAR